MLLHFSPPNFFMQPPAWSPSTIPSSSSVTFYLQFQLPTFFAKPSLPSPPTLPIYLRHLSPPYFYTLPSLHTPSKIFSPTSSIQPFQSVQGSSEEESVVRINSILISDGFPEAWAGITKLTITNSSSLTISQLSLLPYPTYTIARLHLPLETSCITAKNFISSLAFLHTNHALPFVFKNTSFLPQNLEPHQTRKGRHSPLALELSHSKYAKAPYTKKKKILNYHWIGGAKTCDLSVWPLYIKVI